MQIVISNDGTKIVFETSGEGPSLLLVGGSLADHQFYVIANELAQHFTVYNFDRRSHGQSGDTKPYTVEREVEHVGVLIEYAKEPMFMYGHSAGSVLVYE